MTNLYLIVFVSSYDDLENRPLEMMKKTYDTLDFEGHETALPHFEAYLNGIGSYKKNSFTLDKETIASIKKETIQHRSKLPTYKL